MSELCLEHLDEWYRACTIEKCSDQAGEALAKQAEIYFSLCLKRVGNPFENPDRRTTATSIGGKDSVCWQLLELRMNAGIHSSGKHYKNWLFDYSREKATVHERLSSIKAGLKRLLQATVRDYCAGLIWQRDKDQQYGVCSLDEVRDDGTTRSDVYMAQAQDLLGLSGDEAIMRSFDEAAAEELAEVILDEMNARQYVVLLVKYAEANHPQGRKISLDNPVVLEAAQCGKSQLYAARNSLDDFLIEKMRTGLHEDPAVAREWMGCVALALTQKIFSKIKSEKHYNLFLTHLEEQKYEMP